MRHLEIRVSLLAIVFAALAFGACSNDQTQDSTTNVLSRGLNGDPESLDPHKFSSIQAGDVLRDLGEGLLTVSPTGELSAGAAESWRISPDGLIYTFRIRNDARWSTGEYLRAEDFVNSFRRAFDPEVASTNAGRLDVIDNAKEILDGKRSTDTLGVRAIDSTSLEIRLQKPSPFFLSLLIHPSAFPIHHSVFDTNANQNPFRPQVYVSNGAYTLKSRVPGSEIELAKNEFYWDAESTYYDAVVYHVVDPAREVVRYLAGDLDVTSNVDGDAFLQLAKTHESELRVSPKLGTYYYGFNLSREPFKSKPELREALALAIDRQTIVDSVTRRGEIPAYGFVPPGVHNYPSSSPSYMKLSQGQREIRAQQLYKRSGYSLENPVTLELRYNTGGGHEKIALAVSAMWQQVLGAKVTLVKEEFGVFLENVISKQETEIFRLSWTADYNDAQSFLQLFDSGNSNNLTSYSNDDVDSLLQLGAHELDEMRRQQMLRKAEELALSEFPVIPVYFFVSKHLVARHVCGWHDNILDYHLSRTLRTCNE